MSQNKSIRLRTEPGKSKNIQLKVDQDFDFLEVLSLKISQEDLYTTFCSNYGVVVGRIIANKGFGIPNAKVSIFVPISNEDEQNQLISDLYPFKTPASKDSNNVRYNLLLSEATCSLNKPVGNFPTKEEVIDNNIMIEVFEKYYKYTTTTNGAGDYMIFGVPTGQQVVHMDVDLSDIGVASLRPYDMVKSGFSEELFDSLLTFKSSENLDDLAQIKSGNRGVEVIPFWGDQETCEIGITRVDFSIDQKLELTSLFTGSVFTDDGKDSLNKSCKPREDQGENKNLATGKGIIRTIRVDKIKDGEWFDNEEVIPLTLEEYSSSDAKIDENGTFLMVLPMNIGHVITDEEGNLVPSIDNTTGIATKGMYRFAMNLSESRFSRLRRTATVIFPSLGANFGGTRGIVDGEDKVGTQDQKFTPYIREYEKNGNIDDNVIETIKKDFHTFEWKQVYTISQYIKKYKKGDRRLRFLGLKNTDKGHNNPLPFNNVIFKPNLSFAIITLFTALQVWFLKLILSIILVQIGFCFCIRLVFRIAGSNITIVSGRCIKLCFRPFAFLKFLLGKLKNDNDYDPEVAGRDSLSCPNPSGCGCAGAVDGIHEKADGTPGDCNEDYGLVLSCGETKYCTNISRILRGFQEAVCPAPTTNGITFPPCPSCGFEADSGVDGDLDGVNIERDRRIERVTGTLLADGVTYTTITMRWNQEITRGDGVEVKVNLDIPFTTAIYSIKSINTIGGRQVIVINHTFTQGCNNGFWSDCGTANGVTRTIVDSSTSPPPAEGCNDTALQTVECWRCCMISAAAEEHNVWRRVFFDSWLAGSAYMFQYKYKITRNGKENFCGSGSDNAGGDGYKDQECCFGVNAGCSADSGVGSPCCKQCLIRGSYTGSERNTVNQFKDYHIFDHNKTSKFNAVDFNGSVFEESNNSTYGGVSNGASDIGEHIYCNNMYATKIVNLGAVEICKDTLETVEQYLNLYSQKNDFFTGTNNEDGWDNAVRSKYIPSTTYQNPVDYLQSVLTASIFANGGNCRLGPMFRPGGARANRHTPIVDIGSNNFNDARARCYEYEVEGTFAGVPFFDEIRSFSTIFTTSEENVLGVFDGFTYDEEDGKRFLPCGGTSVNTLGVDEISPLPDGQAGSKVGKCIPYQTKEDGIGIDINGRVSTSSTPNGWLGIDKQVRGDHTENIRKNIPYFYFGLKAGATAIDRLKNDYFKF